MGPSRGHAFYVGSPTPAAQAVPPQCLATAAASKARMAALGAGDGEAPRMEITVRSYRIGNRRGALRVR